MEGGNGTGEVAGTFTDMYGNTVSYSSMMTGTCTAYSVPWRHHLSGLGCRVRAWWRSTPTSFPMEPRCTSPPLTAAWSTATVWPAIPAGAAMAGEIIADLCYNTIEECCQIGRREMVIYILS